MVRKIITKSKNFLTGPQNSILTAATVIMLMIVLSRILGLVRQRVLAHFFAPDELSLFFAAFRLPDLVFEVLVFGTFSSAFIPVFTKSLKKCKEEAWDTAGRVVNIGLIIFAFFALFIGSQAEGLYKIMAPGFTSQDIVKIASLAKILFAAQAFFIVSYVLTGVLESLKRFLIPALAPIFYNLGIILGTVFLAPSMGLTAPAVGVVIGAIAHFSIQFPVAVKLGFRFVSHFKPNEEVKKIAKLSLPRFVDLSFEQIAKTSELYLASLLSTASYTYFTLANSLQLLPIGLFGTSIAKAALPTLARQENSPQEFKKTLLSTFYQIVFLVMPLAAIIIVLRIPLIRLAFGTRIFGWEATVQTGMVLSAFGFGIVFQSVAALLERSFYALHDTKTPVIISLISLSLNIIGNFVFVKAFHLPVWALAASFSVGVGIQTFILFYLLNKRLRNGSMIRSLLPVLKSIFSATISGAVMYFVLKFFDRSVWVKRLSFLSNVDVVRNIHFEKFVLDTRYTVNLAILTFLVSTIGIGVYLIISLILKSKELKVFLGLLKRLVLKEKSILVTDELDPEN